MKTRYAFYLAVFAIFVAAAFSQYERKFRAETFEIETLLRQVVVHINDLVKSSADAVDLMRLQAESRFRDPRTGRSPAPIRKKLVERPWGGYALPTVPKGQSPDSLGNLTGRGSLIAPPHELEREIDVALGLNPLFQAALRAVPNAVWVYYTSSRDLINIAPWTSDKGFHFKAELLSHDFYVRGLLERNPERNRFWTDAYIDEYGKGMMVTVAAPVDDEKGDFRGTVALDLSLDVLSGFTRVIGESGHPGTVVLVNAAGQLLAHPSSVSSSDTTVKAAVDVLPEAAQNASADVSDATPAQVIRKQGQYVFARHLERAPWTLIYFVDAPVLRHRIMAQMMPEAAVFLFLLLSLFLVERQFRTSDALRLSEERLRAIMSNAPSAITLKDLDGRYLLVNEEFLRRTGLRAERALGGRAEDFFARATARAVEDGDRKVLERNAEIHYELRTTYPNGRDYDVMVTSFPIRDNAGRMIAIGTISVDVSDVKRAEAEAARVGRHLDRIVNAAGEGICGVGADGTLSFVNDAAARMLGWEKDDLLGRPYTVFLDSETDLFAVCRVGTPCRNSEDSFVRKDGLVFPVEYLCTPILDGAEDADPDGIVIVFEDVTDRRMMENQLRQAQKMEVVGRLTGGIAHDFNNLLQVIQTNLELVHKGLTKNKPELAEKLIEGALESGLRGARLTQKLLAFSRQQTLLPKTVAPVELVSGMLDMLRRTLGDHIEVETEFQEALPPIKVDPTGLENAILNLALNARTAMPRGGRLTIAGRLRRLEQEIPQEEGAVPVGDYVEISVADTGYGMPAHVLEHAFEPFFTTAEVGEGSGLGLSMVYGFSRQSGGHTSLDSEVDKGTIARILLPVGENTDPIDVETDTAPSGGIAPASGTVLVVEDDDSVRESAILLMTAIGYDVLEASNGVEALDVIDRNDAIDILFSDVMMPGGVNGFEVATEATRRRPGLRVILTSGYSEAELARSGVAGDDFRIIGKPYTNEELAAALKSLRG